MHHLSYKTHARVLMPPCKWLDRIIYVAHQGMEHLQQPHLRTWEARVVARKPNGCTISLSSSCNASCRGSNGWARVVGRNILPSLAPCLLHPLQSVGGRQERAPPAPSPCPAFLPSLRAIMPHLLFWTDPKVRKKHDFLQNREDVKGSCSNSISERFVTIGIFAEGKNQKSA